MLIQTLAQIFALPAVASALAVSTPKSNLSCTNPPVRREWETLSAGDKAQYIDAVKCLATKPSVVASLNTTLFDDFPRIHNALDEEIHFVAAFLPWHRWFVHVYESALKDCGYKSVMPYWDWTKYSSEPMKDPMWDSVVGFGGNGSPDHQQKIGKWDYDCVVDGPFKDLRPSYLKFDYASHCLTRQWNNGTNFPGDMFGPQRSPENIAKINAHTKYDEFHPKLETGPHGSIHASTGGDMSPATSPNDPIFFLHHTQIDRLWWMWQQEKPEERNFMFGGIKTQDKHDGVVPPQATLDDTMRLMELADDIKVRDVMTTETDLLCYRY